MKLELPKSQINNPLYVLRRAGYAYSTDPITRESSYMLRLTGELYPRFHLYVEEKPDKIILNLHLDQKKPSYGSGPAHAGEYSGPMVEKEMKRIESWINAVLLEEKHKTVHNVEQPVKKWSDWFFGK